MTLKLLLVLVAIGCALAATAIGFEIVEGGKHYAGWHAAALLAYLTSLVVDR